MREREKEERGRENVQRNNERHRERLVCRRMCKISPILMFVFNLQQNKSSVSEVKNRVKAHAN